MLQFLLTQTQLHNHKSKIILLAFIYKTQFVRILQSSLTQNHHIITKAKYFKLKMCNIPFNYYTKLKDTSHKIVIWSSLGVLNTTPAT